MLHMSHYVSNVTHHMPPSMCQVAYVTQCVTVLALCVTRPATHGDEAVRVSHVRRHSLPHKSRINMTTSHYASQSTHVRRCHDTLARHTSHMPHLQHDRWAKGQCMMSRRHEGLKGEPTCHTPQNHAMPLSLSRHHTCALHEAAAVSRLTHVKKSRNVMRVGPSLDNTSSGCIRASTTSSLNDASRECISNRKSSLHTCV